MGSNKDNHIMTNIRRPQSRCYCCFRQLKGEHFHNLNEIISRYIKNFRSQAEKEINSFKNLKTLDEAIEFAGDAKCPDCKKKFPHQWRIPLKTLENAKLMLFQLLPQIQECDDFNKLIKLIEENIENNITSFGELSTYDTALRLGAQLGIEPESVYLHAGTRKGANALRIDTKRKFFNPSELPVEFRQLSPREIEDCLCIYKKDLEQLNLN